MTRVPIGFTIGLLVASGCAVLTPTQRTEVEKFGKATATYSSFPDEVIRAHAELKAFDKLAQASYALTATSAIKLLNEGRHFKSKVLEKAERARVACSVLREYGNLLSNLSSDDHTAKLQAGAEKFAASLDSAISKYNEVSGKTMTNLGVPAAALVRGAGGLYIKHRQTKALRQAVIDGEVVIEEMAKAIHRVIDPYIGACDPQEQPWTLISDTTTDIQTWYMKVGHQGHLSVAQTVFAQYEKALAAEELGKEASDAIDKLVAAHKELSTAVESKVTIVRAIDEVKVFVEVVGSAKDLYERLSAKD